MKKLLSILLCALIMLTPFVGVVGFVSAAAATQPLVNVSVAPYETISPAQTVTVTYKAQGTNTLTACSTRLEGTELSTGASVSFSPADLGLADGLYTLMCEATDSNGDRTLYPLTFGVSADAELDYAVKNGAVVTDGTVTRYAATALDVTAGYGATTDGSLPISAPYTYAQTDNLAASSASGVPYQLFDIALAGQTTGQVAVSYKGSTKDGERMALKVYNPKTAAWDTVGGFTGSGSVSELVDVATYKDGDAVHVAAVLDYAQNGADTMIWATDPQHYTKFADLNAYYYEQYQYAAEKYENGEVGYIITTGDLVDDVPATAVSEKQWQVASRAMSYVEAVGMPNGLVAGNHDVNTFTSPDFSTASNADYSRFAATFPATRYNQSNWYGGSLNNNTSHYDLVTIGNVDFIVLYLGYGLEATDETIAWANDALKTYSHRTAIIATHEYLDAWQAVRASTGRGELIYNNLVVPNPNVKMVICGHDDGSLMLEKTAPDGRTFYEILADYQFVEAEDPDFYANEHWINSVPQCCGDGYLRLMTVKGDTLSSMTYSPVTDRYNPYGDRESFSIDLNSGTPEREFVTTAFEANLLGDETADTAASYVAVITDGVVTTCTGLIDDAVATATGTPATPSATFYAHAASTVPTVDTKVDLLAAAGFSGTPTVTSSPAYAIDVTIDLNKTPYLYYSFSQPADSAFTFALINDTTTAPWLTFLDCSKGEAFMNFSNTNWNTYGSAQQYATTSMTGCIDMRKLTVVSTATTWRTTQLRFYNANAKNVQVQYLFFGSSASLTPSGNTVCDAAALTALCSTASGMDTSGYTTASVAALQTAITNAKAVNTANADAVKAAYHALECAIGGLTVPKAVIAESEVTSLKNYSLALSNWSVASNLITTQTDDGFSLALPMSGNAWGAATTYGAYTVNPERGKVYVRLDVDADSSWSLQMYVTQDGKSGIVYFNSGIENAFNNPQSDGAEGVYSGLYDVSDAFVMNGFDPSATFTVNNTSLFIACLGGKATFNHVELLTAASDGVVDKSNVLNAIDRAQKRTQALYTDVTWNAMSTCLTNAQAALNNTALAEAELNVYAHRLESAVDSLVYRADVSVESSRSLLPTDPKQFVPSAAGEIIATRQADDSYVIQNTTGKWPSVTYMPEEPTRVFTDKARLAIDLTVGDRTNVMLNLDGAHNWVTINEYLNPGIDGDLPAGDYTLNLPLSDMAEFAGTKTGTIYGIRVFSVGASATSAVTIRNFRVADYDNTAWDPTLSDYGVAATPDNPYLEHAAVMAPEVAHKVDLFTAAGMNAHPTITGWQSSGAINVKVDLNKTPYLYYSIVQASDCKTTFALYNDMSTAPFLTFLDATVQTLNTGSATWESYKNMEQYISGSVTGCIDMRDFLTDASATTWTVTNMNFYHSGGSAQFGYLFFGSAPEYVEEEITLVGTTKGDVDNDGKITTMDARLTLTAILGSNMSFTNMQYVLADISADGMVNTSDVRNMIESVL